MQTRDKAKGFPNFREFSQPPKCLDKAIICKHEKSALLFL